MTMGYFISILLLTVISSLPAIAEKNKSPNIILIFADDLSKGMLSHYGQKIISTPNIDSIAKQGIELIVFMVVLSVRLHAILYSPECMMAIKELAHIPALDSLGT